MMVYRDYYHKIGNIVDYSKPPIKSLLPALNSPQESSF